MTRIIWSTAALALGVVFWSSGNAMAGDDSATRSGFTGGAASGTTMTLGGQGTAAQAASAEDTELTRGGRGGGGGRGGFAHAGYGGGYRGGYGGYGRGYGYGGYGYGGYGRGYGYGGWGWGGGWGYPYYWPYYYNPYLYGSYYGGYYGISGSPADVAAPATYLGSAATSNGTQQAQLLNNVPAAQQTGGLRYDGGPANPIPYPNVDNTKDHATVPLGTGLPVSLNRNSQTSKPYTYKAYGEK